METFETLAPSGSPIEERVVWKVLNITDGNKYFSFPKIFLKGIFVKKHTMPDSSRSKIDWPDKCYEITETG
eukprot:jgi/Botrbrau1/4379/Bobra.105_2s0025.1